MSPKLPRLTAAEVVRAIERDGWYWIRQTGSHAHYRHPMKRGLVTIPMHSGKTIPPGILRSILKQAGLTADALQGLL